MIVLCVGHYRDLSRWPINQHLANGGPYVEPLDIFNLVVDGGGLRALNIGRGAVWGLAAVLLGAVGLEETELAEYVAPLAFPALPFLSAHFPHCSSDLTGIRMRPEVSLTAFSSLRLIALRIVSGQTL